MNVSGLIVEWVEEGAIPAFDLAPPTRIAATTSLFQTFHLLENGHWDFRLAPRSSPRLYPSLNQTAEHPSAPTLPDHEVTDGNFDLVLVTRAIIPGHPVTFGFTLVEAGLVGDAEPVQNTQEALQLATQWLQGLRGVDLQHVHPALRLALARHMHRREVTEAATTRSRNLLLECLSPTQRTDFENHGYFHVTTHVEDGGAVFRILPNHSHNIHQLDPVTLEPIFSFCVVASTYVPVHDQMLVQKLLLELDPTTFFSLANRTTLRRNTEVQPTPPPA